MTQGVSVTMCDECWDQLNPGREPVRSLTREPDCCWRCHRWTDSGIGVRMLVTEVALGALPFPGPGRDAWIRAFNRLEAAVTHHKKAAEGFADTHDEALYHARDKILKALADGSA